MNIILDILYIFKLSKISNNSNTKYQQKLLHVVFSVRIYFEAIFVNKIYTILSIKMEIVNSRKYNENSTVFLDK